MKNTIRRFGHLFLGQSESNLIFKMYSLSELSVKFHKYLEEYEYRPNPTMLYEPVEYIMSLGGKRIRPILSLAAYNLFDDAIHNTFKAAMAVEMFHNFLWYMTI